MGSAGPVWGLITVAAAVLAAAAWSAEDPGARALQQHQLQRQQQQDALQLRMQQQQSGAPAVPAEARQQRATDLLEVDRRQRQRQATDRLWIDQRQRQQQLHDRQGGEPGTAQPFDDAGVRRAKAQIELEQARQAGQRELRRFESELAPRPAAGPEQAPTVN